MAAEIASHGTKGSQIRSTSALLISERSARATIATAAATRTGAGASDLGATTGGFRGRPPRRSGPAPPTAPMMTGPVQMVNAARFAHSQPQGAGWRCRPRSAGAERESLPPSESCRGEGDSDSEAGGDGDEQAAIGGRRPERRGRAREEDQPIGEEDADPEQHARQSGPGHSAPGSGAPAPHRRRGGQRCRPPGADRREHRVGGDGLPDCGRPDAGTAGRFAPDPPHPMREVLWPRPEVWSRPLQPPRDRRRAPLASPTRAAPRRAGARPVGARRRAPAQWSGRSTGCGRPRRSCTSSRSRGRQVLRALVKGAADPASPSTKARQSIQTTPSIQAAPSRRRHPSRSQARCRAGLQARAARASEGRVPGPMRGRQSASSGGAVPARTDIPSTDGTTAATTTTTRAAVVPRRTTEADAADTCVIARSTCAERSMPRG